MSHELPLEVDVHALRTIRESGAPHTVLDVREPQEIETCSLPDTLNIRMMDVPENLARIPSDGLLLVLCHSGMRSLKVAQWLRHNGYTNAQNVAGGIVAWAEAYDPEMQLY